MKRPGAMAVEPAGPVVRTVAPGSESGAETLAIALPPVLSIENVEMTSGLPLSNS
jgi:hypothetical protein